MKMTKIWHWKMDYCKKNGLPPSERWAWQRADEAYFKILKKGCRDVRSN
jgi:hypothetical protein